MKTIIPIRIFLMMLFCAASTLVKAQSGNKISVGLGPELGIPFNAKHESVIGTNDYKTAYGGSLKAEIPVNSLLHVTFSGGYTAFKTKFSPAPNVQLDYAGLLRYKATYKYIPVKAGLRYYFIKYLYAGAEAGAAFKVGDAGGKTSFIYSGGVGGALPVGAHQAIDLGVRYERGYKVYDHTMGWAGISLAYKYQF